MAKVNPGELRDLAEVCTTETVRIKGVSTFNYIPLSRFRCKVKSDKTKFFYSNDNRKMVKGLIFICYLREHLTEDNFIKYKGKYYRITDVVPFDDGLFCQVHVERVD